MTVYAITDTKKGRTGIAPTYLQTTLLIRISIHLQKAILILHYVVSIVAMPKSRLASNPDYMPLRHIPPTHSYMSINNLIHIPKTQHADQQHVLAVAVGRAGSAFRHYQETVQMTVYL